MAHSSGGVINTSQKEKTTQKQTHECKVIVSKSVIVIHWKHIYISKDELRTPDLTAG